MIFEEKKITLKDGRIAVLKSPEAGDAAKMLDFIKTACGETEFLLRSPEDWSGATVEGEEAWIQNSRDSKDSLMITCYVDGDIAGNCDIAFHSDLKVRHRAVLGIALLEKYWNLGIGTAMFAELFACAEKREEVEIVELSFVEGNKRARALYEKFGLRIVSAYPNAFKLKNGNTAAEYLMQRRI